MRRMILPTALALVAVTLLTIAGVWTWLRFDEPTPVGELLDEDATVELDAYDGTAVGPEGAPSILIVGVPHLAQEDEHYSPERLEQVVGSLTGFAADMVAVEYLPADWPVGRGRDYRPELDVARYADAWQLTVEEARAMADGQRQPDGPCELGRAYLLLYDLVNAHHQWRGHGCEEPIEEDRIAEWSLQLDEHEISRIASPVARANGVEELVSFDYQGEDAGWIIHEQVLSLEALASPTDLWQMLPTVNARAREFSAHTDAHDDDLIGLLRYLNSPEYIGLQYWAYEQRMPRIEVGDVGRRQLDNYWLRNQRMFERIHHEVNDRNAERVLVVVGAGHRYFLDELAREHGYRWVDPREWLPPQA